MWTDPLSYSGILNRIVMPTHLTPLLSLSVTYPRVLPVLCTVSLCIWKSDELFDYSSVPNVAESKKDI